MVTIQDVAKAAEVSKATVSYVLADSPRISTKTATRVRKAMDELGYSVNHAARVLSTSRTMTLGIVIPLVRRGASTISQGAYLMALSDFARAKGYDTMLIVEQEGSKVFREAIEAKKIDGAIVMDIRQDGDERIALAKQLGMPTVLLGVPHDAKGLDVVDSDFEQAARELVQHFVDQGKRHLLMVLWPQIKYERGVNFAIRFRDTAVAEAKLHGIDVQIAMSVSEDESPASELRRALEAHPQTDALLIHNDNAVIVAHEVFMELGIDAEKISVAAIVPDQMNSLVPASFPSVRINLDSVARTVIDVLVDRIKNPNAAQVVHLLRYPIEMRPNEVAS